MTVIAVNSLLKNNAMGLGYPDLMLSDETMAQRIRRLREARGLTQTELARRCKTTPQSVSGWERGVNDNIALDTFLCLCEQLDTDPQYLVWGPTRKPPDGVRDGKRGKGQ